MAEPAGPAARGPQEPAAAKAQAKPRDLRLDAFRGLCLVMIFVNHVPGNQFEVFTSRNFGFSDSAEGFVIMSGIAAGLAYSADFRLPGRIWSGLSRIWGRVWTLYLVQMMLTLLALAIAAGVAKVSGDSRILFENNMNLLWEDPVNTLIGLPLMTQQFDYLNILPLYIVLLACAPAFLWGAVRAPWLLLGVSATVWAGFGLWELNLPTWPAPKFWVFNPMSWQMVFVTGLVIGAGMKEGRRLVPVRRGLVVLAAAYLVFSLVDARSQGLAEILGKGLFTLKDSYGLPWIVTDFNKTFVTLPRLLHVLALAYVISAWPAVGRLCASRHVRPLVILGRQSLPVFALGSVLAIGLQGVFHGVEHDPLSDALYLGLGLALQFALAWSRETWPKPARAPR